MRPGTAEETRRLEREEFERGHVAPGEEPPEPVPAATLVLARPSRRHRGLEVLLLRRPRASRFAAGAYVFAGGRVDPEDREPRVHERLPSRFRREAPEALAAAIREQFEETGLLLGHGVEGREELREARRRLAAGESTFGREIRRLELDFREVRVVYLARWITPERLSRRYDTRFYLGVHAGGEPVLGPEHTAWLWTEPGEALERFDVGRLPMLFPTRETLASLAAFRDLDEALETLAETRVEPVRPRLLVREEEILPVLPGDPGYEEAER